MAQQNVTLEATSTPYVWLLSFNSGVPMNLLSTAMITTIVERLRELPSDARVLVLTGREEIFTAGLALDEVLAMDDDDFKALLRIEYAVSRMLQELPVITVAAINGACIGNGGEMVLACDYRVAGPKVRFGLPETVVGFKAPAQRLRNFVPLSVAKRILYEGKLLRTEELLALDLVDVAAEGPALPAALELAARLAKLPPVAIAETKTGLRRVYGLDKVWDDEEMAGALATFHTSDLREGIAAMREKRPAEFKGE